MWQDVERHVTTTVSFWSHETLVPGTFCQGTSKLRWSDWFHEFFSAKSLSTFFPYNLHLLQKYSKKIPNGFKKQKKVYFKVIHASRFPASVFFSEVNPSEICPAMPFPWWKPRGWWHKQKRLALNSSCCVLVPVSWQGVNCRKNSPHLSKVVSTHLWNTAPKPLPTGCKGNPFIVG